YILALLVFRRRHAVNSALYMLRQQWPLCGTLFLMAASVAISSSSGKVLTNVAHSMGVLAVVVAAVGGFCRSPRRFATSVSHALTANLIVHAVVIFTNPAVGIAYDGRWKGLASHSNTLGGIAYCCLWAALASWLLSPGKRKVFALEGSIALILLLGSDSVTSIVAASVAVLLLFVLRPLSTKRARMLTWGMVAVLVSAIGFVWLQGESPLQMASLAGRSSDISGRVGIWTEAVRLINERPLLGWGFDDNAGVILQTGMPHFNYHNGYLDLLVRGGMVALVLLFLAMVRFDATVRAAHSREWGALALAFVASSLVYNIAEVTFHTPRNAAWILLLCCLLGPIGYRWHVKRRYSV
ncbi:O-antigen ligase family protein, partial [Streptococcus pyogenes]|uniref:O-antigen ligase family protein n=1 Tax=Streptococcus pyogenes TaxID=1314 RepID=UPI003D9FF7EA